MSNVPKIVLQRLQSTPVESHPDADLLTAFVERSLPASERAVVLDHISRCGDCREVVALALPAAEAVNVARATRRPVRTGWFSAPVLRWGVVVLGVLAIASVGVLEYQQRQLEKEKLATALIPRDHMANSQRIPAPAAQTSTPPATLPRSQMQTPPARKERSRTQAIANFSAEPAPQTGVVKGAAPMRFSAPTPGPTASANRAVGAAPTTIEQPQRPAASQMAAAQSSPAASTTVEVTAAAPAIETQEAQTSGQPTRNHRDLPLQGRNFTQLVVVDKAKDPVPAPLWTITSTGALRRSLDAGRTWEVVNMDSASVTTIPEMYQGGNAGSIETDQSEKKLQPKQQLEQKRVKKSLSNSVPVFRSLAANGPEVWAGGSAAMLYHSLDAGAHWTRVLPSSAGAVLTGDITDVQFSDPQHGTVITSTPEIWSTADGGQIWQKLP